MSCAYPDRVATPILWLVHFEGHSDDVHVTIPHGRCMGRAARALASNYGDPCSMPGGVTPGL